MYTNTGRFSSRPTAPQRETNVQLYIQIKMVNETGSRSWM